MLNYLVEYIGTFVFLSVILMSGGNAISIGIALAAVILLGGKVSGGNFNPAVSVMMFYNGKLSLTNMMIYMFVQVLGGLTALAYYRASR